MKAWLDKNGKRIEIPGLPAIGCGDIACELWGEECKKRGVVNPELLEVDIEIRGNDDLYFNDKLIAHYAGLSVIFKELAKKLNAEFQDLRSRITASGCELRPWDRDTYELERYTTELYVEAQGTP